MAENATLVKFGREEHLYQLRDEGILYMNNLPYFWKIEDDELRGDQSDGVERILKGNHGTATPVGKPAVRLNRWTIRVPPPQADRINIFCMYAVRPSADNSPLDKRNFRFGDYALVLNNPQAFIDRIESQLPSQVRGKADADLVTYVDNDYQGEVGPFKKLKRFAYQSEWRLVCYDGPGGERRVIIGSISDMCTVVPSAEANEKILEVLTAR